MTLTVPPAPAAAVSARSGVASPAGLPAGSPAAGLLACGVLADALRVLSSVSLRVTDFHRASDGDLLEVSRLAGEVKRAASVFLVAAAGEISHRSDPVLGDAGLARRVGARTAEELLRSSGLTGRDASTAVRVGRLSTDPVLAGVGVRVLSGSVSVDAAESIRAGLSGAAAASDLVADAAELLCVEAATVDPDRLFRRAREVRDELDEAGVSIREEVLRSRRCLRRLDLRDGMKRLVWDYDPETAGVVDEIYDRATSPRRGGPRFVDADSVARADAVVKDPRTVEQLASDAFTEVLRLGAAADPGVLLGVGAPSVRVIVSDHTLTSGVGHGVVEGSQETVGLATVARLACAGGIQPVTVTRNGQVLNLGREQRLYTASQRLALAVRDGGCMWPECDRPPSWCEAHHLDPWSHGGRTDLDRGILLCRYHHLRLHNHGWSISTDPDGHHTLHQPPSREDSDRGGDKGGDRGGSGDGPGSGSRPGSGPGSGPGRRLETKSRALREHLTREQQAREHQARDPDPPPH